MFQILYMRFISNKPPGFQFKLGGMLLLGLEQQGYIQKYFFRNEILQKQQQNYSEIHQLPFLNLNSLVNHKKLQNFLEWK